MLGRLVSSSSVLSWKNDSQLACVEGRPIVCDSFTSLGYVILSEAKDLREAMSLFLEVAANRKSLRVDSSLRQPALRMTNKLIIYKRTSNSGH